METHTSESDMVIPAHIIEAKHHGHAIMSLKRTCLTVLVAVNPLQYTVIQFMES